MKAIFSPTPSTGLIFSLLLASFAPAKGHAQTWYNTNWVYRKAITIDYTKVGAGPHTNFPLLISRIDADLQAKAQSTGNDILFTSADGTTKLDHEIESYTSASGTLVAWVEIPTLSSTANTIIYMYYGNAAAASQQNVSGTWNANFGGVYHLNGAFTDATSNARNGTNTGTVVATGKISNGRGFVRSDGADYITITGLMGSPANVTLSGWANLSSRDATGAHLVNIGDYLSINVDDVTDGYLGAYYNGGWGLTKSSPKLNPAGSGWHYFVYTFDDANNSQVLYMDGAQVGSGSFVNDINYTTQGTNTFIGKHANGNNNYDFDGSIDEVRVSNSVRSAGWILTEYNNQNSPSTFFTVGAESVATKIFTGTGNFSDPARWSDGGVPVAGHNLIIDGACTVDNSGTTDNVQYGTLTIGTATARTLSWAASGTNRLNVSNVAAGAGASTLNMTNGGILIIRGTWTSTNLTFTPGTGSIEIQSTMTLPAAYTTYNNLIINGSGTIVTAGANTTVNNNLIVTSGIYTVGAFSLAVTGTASITSTMSITSTTGAKSFGNLVINNGGTFTNNTANAPITIAGNLQNDGTFSQGTGMVTFTGASSNTVTGTSATTAFGGGITINKGVSSSNVLDVQAVITMPSGGLTITNGTFKLSSNSTITAFTAMNWNPGNIPPTGGLWVNGGTVSTTTDMGFGGLLRVSSGTLNIGDALDERLVLVPGAGTLIIDGGTLNVASRLSYFNASDVLTFNMSSGTFTLGTQNNTVAVAPFTIINTASSFTMSGGTIVIVKSAASNLAYDNRAGTSNVTGGTLQIGNASTPAGNIMEINSTPPIWNLTVNSTNAPTARLTSDLVVKNNVTISGGTLDANNLNLTVAGNWANSGSFTAGSGTVTFNGTTVMSGSTLTNTFNNLTVAASSTVTSSTGLTGLVVNGTLTTGASATLDLGTTTVLSGTLGTISNTGIIKTSVVTATSAVPLAAGKTWGGTGTVEYVVAGGAQTVANGTYNNLKLSNTSGTNTANGNITVGGILTLSGGTVTTGSYTIYINSTGTVNRTSGHVIGNLKKYIATGATSKTFEIGDATNYTPAVVAFASVTTAGDLTASTALGDHAQIASSMIVPQKTVNRTWTLTNSGIVFTTYNATFTFVAADLDGGTDPTKFAVGKYSSGWTYPAVGTKTATSTQAINVNGFSDFQLGEAVNLPVTFISIKASEKNKDIQLVWEVAEESDIKKYEIRRSVDGIHFIKAGEVPATGHGYIQQYDWLDINPEGGNYYYYVRAIQTDGSHFLSNTVAVKTNAGTTAINIFPNPVKDRSINLQVEKMQKGKYAVQVTNLQGQTIFYRVFDHAGGFFNQVISLDKILPAGMYYLQVTNEQEKYIKSILLN